MQTWSQRPDWAQGGIAEVPAAPPDAGDAWAGGDMLAPHAQPQQYEYGQSYGGGSLMPHSTALDPYGYTQPAAGYDPSNVYWSPEQQQEQPSYQPQPQQPPMYIPLQPQQHQQSPLESAPAPSYAPPPQQQQQSPPAPASQQQSSPPQSQSQQQQRPTAASHSYVPNPHKPSQPHAVASNWQQASHLSPETSAPPTSTHPSVADRVRALQEHERVRLDEAAAAALQRAFEAEDLCRAGPQSQALHQRQQTQLVKDEELARQLAQQDRQPISEVDKDAEYARALQLQESSRGAPPPSAVNSGDVPVGSKRVLSSGNLRVTCGHCTVKMDVPAGSRVVICALCGMRSKITD